ncbi:hypothetical protein LguiA_007747 [Lonicera macranthoides]
MFPPAASLKYRYLNIAATTAVATTALNGLQPNHLARLQPSMVMHRGMAICACARLLDDFEVSLSCQGSLKDNHSGSLGAFSHYKHISLKIITYMSLQLKKALV